MKVKVGEITKIKTGKLDANASSADGKYPFFTCSKDPLRINSYSYDCECVLVAGNGDLNVKYYNGKFDAYQRTYIIEDNSNGLLYMPYLYHFLEGYIGELRKQSIGGVIKYIKLGNLTDVLVELPSIEEQKYIVNLMNISLELIELRKKTIDKLDSLVKARFIEMFGDGNLPIKTVKELCYCVVDCPHTTPKYEGNLKNPAIRTSEIKKGFLVWDTMIYVSDKEYVERTTRAIPKAGDIVYGREGTFGNAAILPDGYKFCLGQRVMLLRPDYSKCTSEYLLHSVISDEVYRQAIEKNNASTVAHVNVKDVKQFKVPLPSLDKQNEFANFVKQVDKSREAVKKSLEKTQQLYDSLMQEYFG